MEVKIRSAVYPESLEVGGLNLKNETEDHSRDFFGMYRISGPPSIKSLDITWNSPYYIRIVTVYSQQYWGSSANNGCLRSQKGLTQLLYVRFPVEPALNLPRFLK
jgi:hypothetical protein